MMDQSVINLLDEYCLDQIQHSSCSLRDHLIATCFILEQWQLPLDVCKAGLFHSLYGTETFGGVQIKDRGRVKAAIGEVAEQYVYWFCCLERDSLLNNLSDSKEISIKDRFTGEKIFLTREQCSVMFQILAANFLEQGPRCSERYVKSYSFLLQASDFLDENIMRDVSNFLR